MRLVLFKISDLKSSVITKGTSYQYLYFQDLDGFIYRLTISPHLKVYQRWKKVIDAGPGVIVDGLEIVKYRIIGSYSKPKLISKLKLKGI